MKLQFNIAVFHKLIQPRITMESQFVFSVVSGYYAEYFKWMSESVKTRGPLGHFGIAKLPNFTKTHENSRTILLQRIKPFRITIVF